MWNGLKHKTAPHVTLKSIANNPEIDSISARIRPAIELFRRKRDWNKRLMTAVFDYYELAHSDPHPDPLPVSDPHPNPLPVGEGARVRKIASLMARPLPEIATKLRLFLILCGLWGVTHDIALSPSVSRNEKRPFKAIATEASSAIPPSCSEPLEVLRVLSRNALWV